MRKAIPDEILCEIESFGGLKGILSQMPGKNKVESVAKHHLVLSEPVRLQILLALKHGKLCVCVLKRITSCPGTRLSYHLSTLKKSGMIVSERKKSYLRYYLTIKGKQMLDEI